MNVILYSYEQVLSEIKKSISKNNLLLGNGFNLSLGVNTSYENIFKVMVKNNKEYSIIQSKDLDIEEFIGICKSNIKEQSPDYSKFLNSFIQNKIKLDFMKAVTEIVTKELKGIYEEKNEELYLLFKNFDNFFTLNYDPFLYQLLMSYKKDNDIDWGIVFKNSLPGIKEQFTTESQLLLKEIEEGYDNGKISIMINKSIQNFDLNKLSRTEFKREINKYYHGKINKIELDRIINYIFKKKELKEQRCIENINDGFCNNLFEKELIYSNPKTQNLFFIHGAFHIYQGRKEIYKITKQTYKALYQKIEEIVEKEEENIICIFNNNNKEMEINENRYLKNGLHKLSQLNGNLIIIGSSIADNDSHIFNNLNNSNIKKIYIACSENNKEKFFEASKKYFPSKEVILFDQFTISYKRQ